MLNHDFHWWRKEIIKRFGHDKYRGILVNPIAFRMFAGDAINHAIFSQQHGFRYKPGMIDFVTEYLLLIQVLLFHQLFDCNGLS
jgi:hypothetical protein